MSARSVASGRSAPSSMSATPWRKRPTIWAGSPASWGCSGVKGFFFHEGGDATAAACFKDLARLTGGAFASFDSGAPGRLAALLRAAAAYAAGGHKALRDRAEAGDHEARLLLGQLK